MNLAATAALSVLLLTSGASAFAQDTSAPTQDTPPPMTPAQRSAATARAVSFQDQIKAALTQPVDPLYRAALAGSANDKWVWGLALTAERYDTQSVPPAQLKVFQAYSDKVEKAKDRYAKKHRKEDLPDKAMEDWVAPTPEEAQAVKIVHAINTPDLWLNAARDGVDGALIDQSVYCLTRLSDKVSADNFMEQLLGSMGTITDSSTGEKGTVDIGAFMSELGEADKDDQDLDNEAVCGGTEAWSTNKAMFKAIFTPDFTISVGKDD